MCIVLAQWTFFRCHSSATKLTLLESKITCFDKTRFSWRGLKFRLNVRVTVNCQGFIMLLRFYDFCCVTTKKHKESNPQNHFKIWNRSGLFLANPMIEKLMHPILIHQSVSYWPVHSVLTVQCISQIVTSRSKNTSMMLLNLSLYRCTDTIESVMVNFFNQLIDWFISLEPSSQPQSTTDNWLLFFYCWNRLWLPESDTLWNHFLITLSTARCLYQVQWIPSTLYDSLYVLTLSSLLYRPCVATLVTAVISPRLICSHWLELLIFGHQAAMCLPSVKRLSLASAGPCRLS